ncbi:MAG: DUF2852 domain-containing protein [Hyphomicrobiales bacterium]
MTQTASGAFEGELGETHRGKCGSGLKSRWAAWEVGAVVAGFVVFWPLGLLALFLKWKNGEIWPRSSEGQAPWAGVKKPDFESWRSYRAYGFASSGNAAFDDYKRTQLQRLEEERRKLQEDQRAFSAYVERLRRAKDQDEFDRFMAEHRGPGPAAAQ